MCLGRWATIGVGWTTPGHRAGLRGGPLARPATAAVAAILAVIVMGAALQPVASASTKGVTQPSKCRAAADLKAAVVQAVAKGDLGQASKLSERAVRK